MDSDSLDLEERCENLMTVVVESRKRFGKMCIDYQQKTSLMENKLLNLQIKFINNSKFKTKTSIPEINFDDLCSETDKFTSEMLGKQSNIDNLRSRVKNTQEIVLQLKRDGFAKTLNKPLTAEAFLEAAKTKHLTE